MPAPDLSVAYAIVGRCIIWAGAGTVLLLLLALLVGSSWFLLSRMVSIAQAHVYVRHWEIICSFMGRKATSAYRSKVGYRLTEALKLAAQAYDEHRLEEPEVRAAFALKAFAKHIEAYREHDPAASRHGFDDPESEDNAKRCDASLDAWAKERDNRDKAQDLAAVDPRQTETAKMQAIQAEVIDPAHKTIRSAAQIDFTDH